jgi:AbrB family looped-hinge helix DNA binding protein
MNETIISTKYQVVIPKKIREKYRIKPGQRVIFIPFKHSLRMIIVPPIEEGLGFLEGIDSQVERTEDERE